MPLRIVRALLRAVVYQIRRHTYEHCAACAEGPVLHAAESAGTAGRQVPEVLHRHNGKLIDLWPLSHQHRCGRNSMAIIETRAHVALSDAGFLVPVSTGADFGEKRGLRGTSFLRITYVRYMLCYRSSLFLYCGRPAKSASRGAKSRSKRKALWSH